MNHYVYRISNILTNQHYYGVRSTKLSPIDDLGKKYFSSSTDLTFIKEQKMNPYDFLYKIIRTFDTRRSANDFESKIHNKFHVSSNENFYNRSESITSGWVSYGKVSVKDNAGNTSQVSINDTAYLSGTVKSIQSGMVNTINTITGEKKSVTKENYHINPELICNNTGKVPVVGLNGIAFLIDKNDKDYLTGKFQHCSCGLVSVRDIITNKTKKVSIDVFRSDSNLVGVNKNKIFGVDNPNAKTILIFGANDELIHVCNGNFKTVCIENNLPFMSLKRTLYSGGKLYKTKKGQTDAIKNKTIQFMGWYAKYK